MSLAKPRVIQLSSVHPTYDTRIYHKISKSLVGAGYEVDLMIQQQSDRIEDGINIKALPLVAKKSERLTKVLPEIIKRLRDYPKNSIIHFHDPELIPLGIFLKLKGYKVIYDVHEDVPKDIMSKNWLPKSSRKILGKIYSMFENLGASMFDYIITVVPSITSRFDEKKTIEIRNYPTVVSKNVINKSNEKDSKYVAYVGSLTTRRGIDILVEAIDLVKDQDVKLIIAGDFVEDGLREKLESMKGWQRTNYIGRVNQSELASLLNSSLAGMVVLRGVSSHLDSLPVKMFEYMNAGIPVIASRFPFWDQIIQETGAGITVDENKTTEVSNAIDWIIEHPEEAKKMGENGSKAVLEKYNWAVEEKKLLELYQKLTIS